MTFSTSNYENIRSFSVEVIHYLDLLHYHRKTSSLAKRKIFCSTSSIFTDVAMMDELKGFERNHLIGQFFVLLKSTYNLASDLQFGQKTLFFYF